MPIDANDELTVKLPFIEWNQFLATYSEGIIRTLAPMVNDPTRPAAQIQQLQNQLQQLATKVTAQLRQQAGQLQPVPREEVS